MRSKNNSLVERINSEPCPQLSQSTHAVKAAPSLLTGRISSGP